MKFPMRTSADYASHTVSNEKIDRNMSGSKTLRSRQAAIPRAPPAENECNFRPLRQPYNEQKGEFEISTLSGREQEQTQAPLHFVVLAGKVETRIERPNYCGKKYTCLHYTDNSFKLYINGTKKSRIAMRKSLFGARFLTGCSIIPGLLHVAEVRKKYMTKRIYVCAGK